VSCQRTIGEVEADLAALRAAAERARRAVACLFLSADDVADEIGDNAAGQRARCRPHPIVLTAALAVVLLVS